MPQLKITAIATAIAIAASLSPAAGANALSSSMFDGALPDLLVDQVFSQFEVANGSSAFKAFIYIEVVNLGDAPAPSTVLHWTIRDVSAHASHQVGQEAGFWASGIATLPPIGVNDGETIEIHVSDYAGSMPTPGGAGRYFLHAVADFDDRADESDETNNGFTAQVWGGDAVVQ